MKLEGERFIPATRQAVWDALNDPEVLKACIPGCESLERKEDGGFTAKMLAKVGPVSARFVGQVALLDLDPPNAYRLTFDGQGGIAGFGKGSASVALVDAAEPEPGTTLKYSANAQVGGKLAQIGSRLVDITAAKMADDFFSRFVKRFQPEAEEVKADETESGKGSAWSKSKAWMSQALGKDDKDADKA